MDDRMRWSGADEEVAWRHTLSTLEGHEEYSNNSDHQDEPLR